MNLPIDNFDVSYYNITIKCNGGFLWKHIESGSILFLF